MLLDGKPVGDIFDYRLRQLSSQVLLTVRRDGDWIEYEIEKDEDEDLGLDFEQPLLQESSHCHNSCLFCFIDQLPPGMRPSLYFKDDDLRLSFLNGNYATLTNIADSELDRLIAYRFSPMNISVHTTDECLRVRLMRNPKAGPILASLRKIAAAGLAINCQLVLCPGINDGAELEKTLRDLVDLGPAVNSIALVPVGLTRFRRSKGLYPLKPFNAEEAGAVIRLVQRWQAGMLEERGARLIYAADELYLKSGLMLPPAEAYEDFPQLENGVGMAALLIDDLENGLAQAVQKPEEPLFAVQPKTGPACGTAKTVLIATGTAAAPLLQPYARRLADYCRLPVTVKAVVNAFFGETVTVAGLLTGQDLIRQLKPACIAAAEGNTAVQLILPACLLKADEPVLLDDLTLQQVSDALEVPVLVCRTDGKSLLGLLAWLSPDKGRNNHE